MYRKRQIFEELVLQGGECVFAISWHNIDENSKDYDLWWLKCFFSMSNPSLFNNRLLKLILLCPILDESGDW